MTFSALKIAVTCAFTVFSERSRSRAIVLFDWPALNRLSTSV